MRQAGLSMSSNGKDLEKVQYFRYFRVTMAAYRTKGTQVSQKEKKKVYVLSMLPLKQQFISTDVLLGNSGQLPLMF